MFGAGHGGRPASRSSRSSRTPDEDVTPGAPRVIDILAVDAPSLGAAKVRAQQYAYGNLVPDGFDVIDVSVEDSWEGEGTYYVEIKMFVGRGEVSE